MSIAAKNGNIRWWTDSRISYTYAVDMDNLQQSLEEGDFDSKCELSEYLYELVLEDFWQRLGVSSTVDEFIEENFPNLPPF